ncbi:MAG: phosphoribosyltransferase [Chloroflexi bacterium]|nr:phosphoribosyltransferase [Chloroflexota bacterium]
MQFRDRHEAGQALAEALSFLKGQPDVVILAIPRGGVVVGYQVAKALGLPLDVYITRKLGAPYNSELALGAVAGDGSIVLDEELIQRLGIPRDYIARERERQAKEIERQLERYRGDRKPLDLKDKIVVLVDDGVATGSTTRAAIQSLRKHPLRKLILAIPVGPPETAAMLSKEVDQGVFLSTPEHFWAVGGFYLTFDQTSDDEVVALLRESALEQPQA